MSFNILEQCIHTFPDKVVGKGATLDEIVFAELTLKVSFPESYKLFLRTFGWARFAHESLYGLGADVPTSLDLVKNTNAERNVMRPLLPPHLLPVMNDGSGNHYCLDLTNNHNSRCPIVFWDHDLGDDQYPEFISSSFETWLTDLLSELRNQ